jgi:hypothetical protein
MKGDKRKGFILYLDSWPQIELLSNEEAGQLLKAIYEYLLTDHEPVLERPLELVFAGIKAQLERDGERYKEICKKRSASAKAKYKKMEADAYKWMQKDASECECIQTDTNDANRDRDIDKDSDRESERDKSNNTHSRSLQLFASDKQQPKKADGAASPTIEEVTRICLEKGMSEEEAKKFYYYYDAQGWVTTGGQKIKRIDSMVNRWVNNQKTGKDGNDNSNSAKRNERNEELARDILSHYM